MITTTLSSDKSRSFGFYKDTLRRLKSFILFYGGVSFLFFPLQYLMEILREGGYARLLGMGDVFNLVSLLFFGPFMCVVPVIVATQIFGYMHSKKAVDLYHSLPIRREEMLLSGFAAGMTAILIPLTVNYGLVAVLKLLRDGPKDVPMVLLNYLYVMVICFAALSIAVFVFTQVGTKFDAIVLTLGLYVILPALYLCTMVLMGEYLYGFSMEYSIKWDLLLALAPHLLFYYVYKGDINLADSNFPGQATGNITLLAWLLIGIFLLIAAAAIYRRRKSEMAENTSTSGVLKIFIKIAGTYLASVMMGFIFEGVFSTGKNGFSMFLTGVVLGSLLSYLTMEVILSRTFRAVFKSLPMAAVLAAAMCGFTVVLQQGGLGYADYVPAVDEIQSITVNYRGEYGDNEREGGTGRYVGNVTLESQEAKTYLTQLHQAAIAEHKGLTSESERPYYHVYNYITLQYKMNNGKVVNRVYSSNGQEFITCLAKLESTQEFITKTHPVFRTEYEDLGQVVLIEATGVGSVPLTLNSQEMEELFTCMQEDLLSRTYEQLIAGKPAIGFLNISYEYDEFIKSSGAGFNGYPKENYFNGAYLTLTEDFTKTVSFLREKGYSSMLEPRTQEIVGLVFHHPGYYGSDNSAICYVSPYRFDSYFAQDERWLEEKGYAVYREDAQTLEELLPKMHGSIYNGSDCLRVDYVLKDNLATTPAMEFPGGNASYQSAYGYIHFEDLPEDVKQELIEIDPYYYEEIIYTEDTTATATEAVVTVVEKG